ncbi:MAG: ribosome assembly factor SBDS [Candidatus Micrarchaeota archaeon]
MSQISNTLIARIERNGERFEVLVDPKKGYDFKTGVKKDFDNVLMSDEIFSDANKGQRQNAAAIKKAFHTEDSLAVARQIIEQGDLQLSTDQRRKLMEEKRLKVIEMIARNCIDPRTKTPHPEVRINLALEQAKVHFDAFKPVEEQFKAAVEAMREIIPISMEKIKVAVKVPAEHAARCYGILKEFGISREEYGSDGSLVCVCEMPAGMQSNFYDRLNKMTGGQVQTKVL